MLDDADRRLLRHLLAEPGLSNADLAERAGLSASACWRRLERLQESGVISGQHAKVDWAALGWEVEVSLRITLDKTDPRAFDEFLAAARLVPEVTEIQTFLGKVDVRLHLIARDLSHYQQIYRERILVLPHISEIEALVQLSTVARSEALPL